MGADAPTQTGRFEDALLPHSFGVPFRKRSVTEARHFRNKTKWAVSIDTALSANI